MLTPLKPVGAGARAILGISFFVLFIALWSWAHSYDRQLKDQLSVRVYFCTQATCAKDASKKEETAVAALNAWPTADLGDRDPFGWLCQVAEQRIIDAHRRFAARKRAADREVSAHATPPGASRELIDLLAASLTSASQAFARNERQAMLNGAIAQLPEESRNVLRWRYVDGLPTKEIAEMIGKSDGAVRVMLTRTLHKLQELLGPEAAP